MEEVLVMADDEEPMDHGTKKWNKYMEEPWFREAYEHVMRMIEEEERMEDEENAAAAEAAKPGLKRAHAPKAGELDDVGSVKRVKCNYWLDPAYAKRLETSGPDMARTVALMHQTDREIAASKARRQQRRQARCSLD